MTTKKQNNISIALIGIALVLPVFIAVPMLGIGDMNVSINATLISSQVPQTGVGFQPGAIVGPGSAYPKLLVAPNGTGFCVWLETKDVLSTNGTHVFIGGVENATTNMTINIMQTTGSIYSANGWKSWNQTAIKKLNSVYQLSHRGFLDAAFDNTGKLWVFYSSQVISDPADLNRFEAWLWDGVTPTKITGVLQLNWTSGLAPLSSDGMGVSIASRGAAGQILFDVDGGRHLLWSTGNELLYRYNDMAIQPLATADYMGECSMATNSTKHLIVVYAAGNATVSNKVIYRRTATNENIYSDFNTPVAISSDTGKECLTPYVFVDGSNTPHYLWSTQEDTSTHRYVVKFKRGSNPAVNISTDYGGLGSRVISPNEALAWKPCGAYYRNKLNIFYIDNTNFTGTGGGDNFYTNILWQSYSDLGDLSNNKAVVLSNQESYDDLNPSIALPINALCDDMYVICGSYSSIQRVNIVKIDEVAPSITVTSPLRGEIPLSYTLTFTASNSDDLANLTVKCGLHVLELDPYDRAVDLPASLLTRGSYALVIEAMDDVGNTYQYIGVLEFTNIPPELIITIAVIAIAAVLLVLLLWYYKKNKERFMRRGLGMKMGGKPAEKKSWDEEGAEEEDAGGGDEGSVDLKKDLKKVDT